MQRPSIISGMTFSFAVDIVKLCRVLISKNGYTLARQLLRAGTSIGANVEEASAAQSKKDFISKMAIASKEARETKYWLRLLQKTSTGGINFDSYLHKVQDIVNVLTKIIKTSKAGAP